MRKIGQLIGNRIDIWQKEHGYTNQEVGNMFGVVDRTIYTWRIGVRIPNMAKINKMREHGVNFDGIDGVPSKDFTVKTVRDFIKENKIASYVLCRKAGVNYSCFYNMIKGKEVTIDTVWALESYINSYNSAKNKPKEEKETEEMTSRKCVQSDPNASDIDLEDNIPDLEDLEPAQECDDERPEPIEVCQESSDCLSRPIFEKPAYKKTTLRELLAFSEKHNVLDAEIRTDGGFDICGFKLVIEEDDKINFVLKTR